jgi:hypothetical protein
MGTSHAGPWLIVLFGRYTHINSLAARQTVPEFIEKEHKTSWPLKIIAVNYDITPKILVTPNMTSLITLIKIIMTSQSYYNATYHPNHLKGYVTIIIWRHLSQ